MADVHFPNDSEQVYIVGKNGSGKTQAAVDDLSYRRFDCQPWVVLNFKGDKLIRSIPGIQTIGFNFVPRKPGLYMLEPLPHESEALEDFLWRIWKQERVGVFTDEAYMIPQGSAAFRALLTQGRSKHIPLITLSQRPVYVDRFVASEATYFRLFWLNDAEDRKSLRRYIPNNVFPRLPAYHSLWYDTKRDQLTHFLPARTEDQILEHFAKRIGRNPTRYL